jgi:hypothetical protein
MHVVRYSRCNSGNPLFFQYPLPNPACPCFAYSEDIQSEYIMTTVAVEHARKSLEELKKYGVEEMPIEAIQKALFWNLFRLDMMFSHRDVNAD